MWSEEATSGVTSGVTAVLAESILEVIPIIIRHIYDEKIIPPSILVSISLEIFVFACSFSDMYSSGLTGTIQQNQVFAANLSHK